MPSSQHNEDHDDFTARIHTPGETVTLIRQTKANADIRVTRDDLEENTEYAKCHGILEGVSRFDERDEEQSQGNPPHVVAELATHLLRHQTRRSGRCVIVQGVH